MGPMEVHLYRYVYVDATQDRNLYGIEMEPM